MSISQFKELRCNVHLHGLYIFLCIRKVGLLCRIDITCLHEKDPPLLYPAGIRPMKKCDWKNQPIRMQHYEGFSAFPEVPDRSDFRLRLFKMADTGKAVTFYS